MADFIVNQEIKTAEAVIEVTVNPEKPLPVGRHRFRLVVFDDAGNESKPDEVIVFVADRSAPTAVLIGPDIVNAGESFQLSGEKSFDLGGSSISSYHWTYLGPAIS